jgi:acetyl-CoA acyltransferase 1
MLAAVLKAVYASVNLDPKHIEDVCVGNVLPAGGGAAAARMAALYAGIPHTSSIQTVNRQCSSGLSAVNIVANAIRVGQIDIGIGPCLPSLNPPLIVVICSWRQPRSLRHPPGYH